MSGKEYRQSKLLALYISLAKPSMYPGSDFPSNRHVDFSNRLTSSGHLGTESMDWVVVSSCMAPNPSAPAVVDITIPSPQNTMLIILKICYSLPDLEWHQPHPVGRLKSVEASQVTWAASSPKVQHRPRVPTPAMNGSICPSVVLTPLVNSMSGKEYRQSNLLALYISLAQPSMYPVSDFSSNRHVDFSNRLTSSGHLSTVSMDWVVVSSCMAPAFCPRCCWHHHFQSSE